MTLEEAKQQVRVTMEQMNSRYGGVVFNEWAILHFRQGAGRVLEYAGPRSEQFRQRFVEDLGSLRAELTSPRYQAGDFEFARHAAGTAFEAFIVLGEGTYLICNNTTATMQQITQESRWLDAQKPFAELGDKLRSNPVSVAL